MSDEVTIALPQGEVCGYCGQVEGPNGSPAETGLVFTRHTVDGLAETVRTRAHAASAHSAARAGEAWIIWRDP